MKKLLWVGDAGVPSGFAVATHHILEVLQHEYDISVLAINFRGDPTGYPDFLRGRMWAAAVHGDMFGVRRLVWMCDLVKPDVIVLQNDGWNVPAYVKVLQASAYKDVPIVAIVAVDGKNFCGAWLDGVTLAIFWTQFALDEAYNGGYKGLAEVIPLGVDTDIYYPMDKKTARRNRGIPEQLLDKFIVGNVNRNQSRKRWDLTIRYFAEWVHASKVADAFLYLHCAPTGDTGVDVKPLARYYGILPRLILMEPAVFYGIEEAEMRDTYNSFDVQVSTTQGEGFGLTTLEGMACGVPQIVPEWSALGEICADAAWMVPCTTTAIGPPYVNVIGGVADETKFISALRAHYTNYLNVQTVNSQDALKRALEPRFRWSNVGQAYVTAIGSLLAQRQAQQEKEEVMAS